MATTCLPIEGTTDAPTPKQVLRTVYETARTHGYELPDIERYKAGDTETDDRPRGGVTPDFMTDGSQIAEAIRTGVAFPFSWREAVDGAGTNAGSAHMTTTFVRAQKTIQETVAHLCETGQIDMAAGDVVSFCQGGVNPVEVTFYAVATYAKGWLAERIITDADRWSKGSQSNDEAGQDVFDRERGEYRQVKCVTKDKQEEGWLYYQWDMRGTLVVGDDYLEVHEQAVDVTGMPKTVTRRTHGRYTHNGQRYRYIWW